MAKRSSERSPRIGILMGSDSDWEVMSRAAKKLRELDIAYEIRVTSAHRSPAATAEYASRARERGIAVLIVGAGAAAHLAGAVAAHTAVPVIGVPLSSTSLQGLDALLSTVQMPAGVPVATMAIGAAGAENAALFAAQILATADPRLAKRLQQVKQALAEQVEIKNARLQKEHGRD